MKYTEVLLAVLTLVSVANAVNLGFPLPPEPADVELSLNDTQGEIVQPHTNETVNMLEEFLMSKDNDNPQAFVAASKAISRTTQVDSRIQSQYDSIFGKLCDKALAKFKRLGECISATPQFQELNSSFWYQAAKKELCGYDIQWEPKPKKNQTTTLEPHPAPTGNATHSYVPQMKFHHQVTIPQLVSTIPDIDSSLSEIQNANPELQAQYLYLLRKTYASTHNITDIHGAIDQIRQDHGLPALDKRALSGLLDLVGTPTVTMGSCLGLCDLIRQGSNTLDQCWEVTSLTVVYAVCTVGCYYYL